MGLDVCVSVEEAVGVTVSVSVGEEVDVRVSVEVSVGVTVGVPVGIRVAVPRKPRKGGKAHGNAQAVRNPKMNNEARIFLRRITLSSRYPPSYWRIPQKDYQFCEHDLRGIKQGRPCVVAPLLGGHVVRPAPSQPPPFSNPGNGGGVIPFFCRLRQVLEDQAHHAIDTVHHVAIPET